MKIRNGFISNSSSSSFIIKKVNLTTEQIKQIHNHIEHSIEIGMFNPTDMEWYYKQDIIKDDYPTEESWKDDALKNYKNDGYSISEDEYSISGWTLMNNFNMHEYLKLIGVKAKHIKWGD